MAGFHIFLGNKIKYERRLKATEGLIGKQAGAIPAQSRLLYSQNTSLNSFSCLRGVRGRGLLFK